MDRIRMLVWMTVGMPLPCVGSWVFSYRLRRFSSRMDMLRLIASSVVVLYLRDFPVRVVALIGSGIHLNPVWWELLKCGIILTFFK